MKNLRQVSQNHPERQKAYPISTSKPPFFRLFDTKGRDQSLNTQKGRETTQPFLSDNLSRLFHEADSHTVLLRSLERIDGVTEVLSDNPVLVDAGGNDGRSDNLSPLL